MSAIISANPRAHSPVDRDLQILYDEVWAGFAAEDTPNSEKDLDGIYSVYGTDSDIHVSPMSPSSAVSNPSFRGTDAQSTFSYDTSPSNAYSRTSVSGSFRRLPPTPSSGRTPSASPRSPPILMPEADPYHPPRAPSPAPRPSHLSTDSYTSVSTTSSSGSSLLRKATAGSIVSNNASSRKLPEPPSGIGLVPNGRRGPSLPVDPRPISRSHVSSASESISVSRHPSANGYTNGHSAQSSRDENTSYAQGYARTKQQSRSSERSLPSKRSRNDLAADYLSPIDNNDSGYSSANAATSTSANGQRSPSPYKSNRTAHVSGTTSSPQDPVGEVYIATSVPSINRWDSTGSYTNGVNAQGQPVYSMPVPVVPAVNIREQPEPQYDYHAYGDGYYDDDVAGPSSRPVDVARRPSELLRDIASYRHRPEDVDGIGEDGEWESAPGVPAAEIADRAWEWGSDEDGEESFINFSLLSHLAVRLKDKVPRGTHVKGSIPYPNAFTGRDIVSTIQSSIQRELALSHHMSNNDRRAALQVARSLQSQLFFYEVEWGGRVLQDGVEDVYMFLDDPEGSGPSGSGSGSGSSGPVQTDREGLPTGVVTMLTRCYVPTCVDENPCYAYDCPKRGKIMHALISSGEPEVSMPSSPNKSWPETVPKEVLESLPESEINRQTIIHKIISKEDQYIRDLNNVEVVFLNPLRNANPPIISPPSKLEEFINAVFGNILDLRDCNRRLLEVLYVRQREQQYVIQRIGDVFLTAAAEFRSYYPEYIGNHPLAEKRLKDEIENNADFRLFLEHASRNQSARHGQASDAPRLDLKHFLGRPSEHLQKYPVLLEAIFNGTAEGNPDADFLVQAIEAIRNLQNIAQLRTFQAAMCVGAPGKWEWHDLVATEVRKSMPKEEAKRQSIIFELIKGEMAYVKDLENIEIMYIKPLRAADPPIITPDRLNQFIKDVFHNFDELHVHHLRLVEKFHQIQLEQHPTIRSVTAAMFDAALNFRDAYMEYIPNYPIAAYRIDDEMANNLSFKNFVDSCVRHPDAHRLDMKNFINRPIPRLLRYELLLKGILDETPPGHDDRKEIPQVLEVIKSLGKDTEPGVVSAKQKVELWRYNSNLVFKPGEWIDMDLLDESRSFIHSGRLLRPQQSGLEWSGWSEMYVLLFDNYLVLTKPKERDGVTKYHVNRRPIPLDLLTLGSFNDPAVQRGAGLLRNLRGHDATGSVTNTASPDSAQDSRSLYPYTLNHSGRLGGQYVLYAETAQARTEWQQKLEEAIGIRKVVQESNKVFEVETLSADTFLVPSSNGQTSPPSWNQESSYTGKVTCSVPFTTADGRGLVAIGCAEGVWIGFRHDPKSMRRVLHLKLVTQCAMLEDFGIFLVLADKSLFAYHIEALVPSSPHAVHTSQVPQKLNGNKDVHFFSVGTLHGRTLVIYMKKKGLDSIFRVLEPVGEKINEKVKAPSGFSSKLFRSAKSEWFRIYRDFFLPSESFDLIFLKAKIAILCTKGFEIMDLNDFKSVTIPQRDDPRFAQLAKRCESCRPLGMFRSAEDEFLLCYDEFGLYVDKHGDPSRSSGTIEWEGTAERVALHSPYVLLFDQHFIEIRHLETGRLAQIIPGNEVRCIWDGRGVSSNNVVSTPIYDARDEPVNQDAQVHAVMNAPDAGPRSRAIVQQVFELLPTVPLFLPETPPDVPEVYLGASNSTSAFGSSSGNSYGQSRTSVGGYSQTTPSPHSPPSGSSSRRS